MGRKRLLLLWGLVVALFTLGLPNAIDSAGDAGVTTLMKGAQLSSLDDPASVNKYLRLDLGPDTFSPMAAETIAVTTRLDGSDTTLGEIRATLGAHPNRLMEVGFVMNEGFHKLCACYEFHWVQIIVVNEHDPKPTVADTVPNMPTVDPPACGWDGMYVDQDDPPDGIQEDERCENGVARPGLEGDIVDREPWYLTAAEEAKWSRNCQIYYMNDTPSWAANQGEVKFHTYLIMRNIHQKELCILAGFSWSIKNVPGGHTGPTELAIGEDDQTTVTKGLANGNITGWTVRINCELNNPSGVDETSWGAIKSMYK